MTAQIGSDELEFYGDPRPDLLAEVARVEPEPDREWVRLEGPPLRFRSTQRMRVSDCSDGVAVPAPAGTQPAGPAMVTIEYRHRQGAYDELLAALRDARFSRRRTGATSWRVWQDATDPDRIIEQFIVALLGRSPAPARTCHPARRRPARPRSAR
jgi:hypothetical protein